jgi:hypothetical protein
MTPKEKAKELVDNYVLINETFQFNGNETIIVRNFSLAKQCGLIAVEFAREFITGNLNESFDKTMYLFEVKQEIEKL